MPFWNSKPNVEKLKAKRDIEGLIKALNYQQEVIIRKRAAIALSNLGDTTAINPLLTALEDKNFEVRKAVADTLDYLGWRPPPDATGARYWIAKQAWKNCAAIGEPAIEPLMAMLDDTFTPIAVSAARTICDIDTESTVELLIAMLDNSEWSIRSAAVQALGNKRSSQAIEPLITMLNRSNGFSEQSIIIEALGNIGDSRVVGPLIDILTSKESIVRINAATGLGKLGDTRAVEPLITLANDSDAGVRQATAEALGQLGDGRAIEPLLVLITDWDMYVRIASIKALGQIGHGQAVESLINALTDELPTVAEAAATSLGQIGDERAVEPLLVALKDKTLALREAAAVSLGQIGDERAKAPLVNALKEDWDLRHTAAAALTNFLPSDEAQQMVEALEYERVQALMTTFLASKSDRQAIGDELRHIGAAAVEPLIQSLTAQDRGVFVASAHILGEIGDSRAVEPMLTILKNAPRADLSLLRPMADALGKIGDVRAIEPLLTILHEQSRIANLVMPEALLNILQRKASEISSNQLHTIANLKNLVTVTPNTNDCGMQLGPSIVTTDADFSQHRQLARQELIRRGEEA